MKLEEILLKAKKRVSSFVLLIKTKRKSVDKQRRKKVLNCFLKQANVQRRKLGDKVFLYTIHRTFEQLSLN